MPREICSSRWTFVPYDTASPRDAASPESGRPVMEKRTRLLYEAIAVGSKRRHAAVEVTAAGEGQADDVAAMQGDERLP